MQSQIAIKVEKLERQDPSKLNDVIDWLIAFKKVYVGDFEKVLKLVPQSVWKNYKSMGMFKVKGIHEIDERRRASKLLRDQWFLRPGCLHRSSKKKKNEKASRKT